MVFDIEWYGIFQVADSKDQGGLEREVHLQEDVDPQKFWEIGTEVWRYTSGLICFLPQ